MAKSQSPSLAAGGQSIMEQAMIAVGCKLIRVFYALLTKGTDYDAGKLSSDIIRPEERKAA